ncbi:MBL fold metallo-hydrolase [Roseomonas sp. BN140053]|uniref:MBL fold metallo-hydrolase n=1 Tax=Roseomonas sp. BN140053 TaxID=3391898 RepID=UPI0039EBEDCB
MNAVPQRRAVLAAAALLPALPRLAAAQPAAAPAAPAARQAPGFFRSKLGGATLLQVNDGFGRRPDPARGFIGNAEPAAVEAALRDAFLPTEFLEISYTVPMLERADGIVAFDAGTGGQLGPTTGGLAANLRAAGRDPGDVRQIVFTHFHGDHVTGLTTAENARAFPNAELIVPQPEWDYWLDEATASRAPEAQRAAFANVRRRFGAYEGRVRRFRPGEEVLPGVLSVETHGHTPGHTSFIVTEGDARVLIFGDVTNRPELFVRNPGWHAVFDMDAQRAEATRRRVLDMAATERLRIAAYHWPFPGLGYVAKDGNGYRWAPQSWSAAV